MKKKIISSLLAVAMVASLVACGGGNNGGGSKSGDGYHFEIVSKGFQHQYWQAVLQGAEEQCKEYGDTMNFVGPASESDIQDQVQMLNSAINAGPVAIGLAALDTEACLDGIKTAFDGGIPIVGFDSGVPGAPEGAVKANCATNNLNAGAIAAENMWEAIKDKATAGKTRVGVMSQDATSQSVGDRGLGFINKLGELAIAAGLKVAVVGNDKFVNENSVDSVAEGEADMIIDVRVPAQVDNAMSTTDCLDLLSNDDIVGIFGSNQFSAENMITANGTSSKKFGTDVVGIGFDAGATLKAAVKDGTLLGAVTQSPLQMGRELIKALHTLAEGGSVSDVDTGCAWYTSENMDDADIAPNLYD